MVDTQRLRNISCASKTVKLQQEFDKCPPKQQTSSHWTVHSSLNCHSFYMIANYTELMMCIYAISQVKLHVESLNIHTNSLFVLLENI